MLFQKTDLPKLLSSDSFQESFLKMLKTLFRHGIYHMDLHANNIFMKEVKGKPKWFIIDYGRIVLWNGYRTEINNWRETKHQADLTRIIKEFAPTQSDSRRNRIHEGTENSKREGVQTGPLRLATTQLTRPSS